MIEISFVSHSRKDIKDIYLLYETKTPFRAANNRTTIVELHMIVTRKQDTLVNGAHGG